MFRTPEPDLLLKEKLKIFGIVHWRGLVCCFVPILSIVALLPFPPENYQWTAYCLLVMAVFWVTECIPLPVTSFLPLFVFPISGIMSTIEVCNCFVNDSVFMFIGSLILAASVEQSGLHKRIAFIAIRSVGYSHEKLLVATVVVTTFVSMWITNTAATTMMVPIVFAILKVFEDHKLLKIYDVTESGEKIASDITTCYFCTATYSATIGGIGTLIGTATNLVFKGLFVKQYPDAPEFLSFPMFSAFGIPYMILLDICMILYILVIYVGFMRPKSDAAKWAKVPPEGLVAAETTLSREYKALGPLTFWEFMVILLFGGAMVSFFCRSPQIFRGWGDLIKEYFGLEEPKFVQDSALAALVIIVMLLFPSNLSFCKNLKAKFYEDLPKKRIPSVLNWTNLTKEWPFSFIFLLVFLSLGNMLLQMIRAHEYVNKRILITMPTRTTDLTRGFVGGGGFALSKAAEKTGLNEKIGNTLKVLEPLPNIVVLLLIIIVIVLVTNLASNIAVANVFTPISMTLAKVIGRNPLSYALASGLSASFCFLLPVGTPGNLIVQSAANIPTVKMVRAGLGPTISTIIITWLAIFFYAPIIWPDLGTDKPTWVT